MKAKVCFIGGGRYRHPLVLTTQKKFRALCDLADIYVIGFSEDACPCYFSQHANFYLLPQFSIPSLRYLAMLSLGTSMVLWLIFRHKIQVIVAQSPYEGLAAAVAKIIACWSGRRVSLVIESHGDFENSFHLYRRIRFPSLHQALMVHAARFALNQADILRAVSTSTRKQLEEWAPGKLVIQFPTWTDIDLFLDVGANRTLQSSQHIIYAGVLAPLKGIHHLLEAFTALVATYPEARLSIVGRPQNAEYAAKLKATIEQEKLKGRVQLFSEMPQTDLAQLMGSARVFVLPSLSEGLPRVLIEAMATGTPVIASRVGGIPELVQDQVTGFLIPPGDEECLAEWLRWFLEHPREANEMGRKACVSAKTIFSTQSYVSGYQEIFEKGQQVVAPLSS